MDSSRSVPEVVGVAYPVHWQVQCAGASYCCGWLVIRHSRGCDAGSPCPQKEITPALPSRWPDVANCRCRCSGLAVSAFNIQKADPSRPRGGGGGVVHCCSGPFAVAALCLLTLLRRGRRIRCARSKQDVESCDCLLSRQTESALAPLAKKQKGGAAELPTPSVDSVPKSGKRARCWGRSTERADSAGQNKGCTGPHS
jgi:hypothetical protein